MKIEHIQTSEDENFKYGYTTHDGVKVTDWCRYKKDGNPPDFTKDKDYRCKHKGK